MGPVFMCSIKGVVFQLADKYILHTMNENTHLWKIYFRRDPEENYKNDSFQSRLFNIEVINPRDLEVSL